MLLSGLTLRTRNQSLLRFNGNYLGVLEREGIVPSSGVLAPSARTPIIIRTNIGTVNKTIEAADLELVGTAAFTYTVCSATGCKAAGSSDAEH